MRRRKTSRSPNRPAFAEAPNELAALIAPLLRANGISVKQLEKSLRHAAVQLEASRFAPRKINKAQIAFSTGLSRSEVARILRLPKPSNLNPAQEITDIWTRDARFLTTQSRPSDLPVFGKGKSFEQLTKVCGKGLPVRAILDELLDRGTVAFLPDQKLRLQQPIPKPDSDAWAELTSRVGSAVNDALVIGGAAKFSQSQAGGSRRVHLKRTKAATRPPTVS